MSVIQRNLMEDRVVKIELKGKTDSVVSSLFWEID